MLLIALLAPVIAPYDYVVQDYEHIFESPNRDHLLGTDNLGRDVLSRLILGIAAIITDSISNSFYCGFHRDCCWFNCRILRGIAGQSADAVFLISINQSLL